MKKEVYINGKDCNIDADFFVGLGADRDSIKLDKKPMGNHTAEFVLCGNRYLAQWNEWINRIDISCPDLSFQEGEIADQRLYALSGRITQEMLGGLEAKKMVVWPEGMKPELMILLYEK